MQAARWPPVSGGHRCTDRGRWRGSQARGDGMYSLTVVLSGRRWRLWAARARVESWPRAARRAAISCWGRRGASRGTALVPAGLNRGQPAHGGRWRRSGRCRAQRCLPLRAVGRPLCGAMLRPAQCHLRGRRVWGLHAAGTTPAAPPQPQALHVYMCVRACPRPHRARHMRQPRSRRPFDRRWRTQGPSHLRLRGRTSTGAPPPTSGPARTRDRCGQTEGAPIRDRGASRRPGSSYCICWA